VGLGFSGGAVFLGGEIIGGRDCVGVVSTHRVEVAIGGFFGQELGDQFYVASLGGVVQRTAVGRRWGSLSARGVD